MIAVEFAIVYGIAIALVVLVTDFYLRKFKGKKKGFPSCHKCDRQMVQIQHLGNELPYEIKHYLNKYNLPKHVVRRFICPVSHRELWIAPPVGDQRKSLFVSHRL